MCVWIMEPNCWIMPRCCESEWIPASINGSVVAAAVAAVGEVNDSRAKPGTKIRMNDFDVVVRAMVAWQVGVCACCCC